MQNGNLGQGQAIYLTDSLDTWDPTVRGSSARVFFGTIEQTNNHRRAFAVKFMRSDKPEYAPPLFREEAIVLQKMDDLRGVMKLSELGFILFENPDEIPSDIRAGQAHHLTGQVRRFTIDETPDFLEDLDARVAAGWLPYLALEYKDRSDNLYRKCDENWTLGRFFPLDKALKCVSQICEILQTAHERGIVYRDHKIIHYYWDDEIAHVSMIDWNVAQYHPQGLTEHHIKNDLVQFAARTLHYIFVGRPAPGALPLGPTKPEDIDRASAKLSAEWRAEDRERLSDTIRDTLAGALYGRYASASELWEDLSAHE